MTAPPVSVPGSLLGMDPRSVTRDGATVTAHATVDPGHEVFPGHYPGFPVLPGVCLIEYADRSILLDQRRFGRDLELTGVERCRFRDPVFPGDELTLRVEYSGEGDGELRSDVVVSTGRGRAAELRLVHRAAGTGAAG
ncbi:3-hydroxyacyl-ACP dehydratase FabZ family protein [Streptomyces sp. NRRL S-37]|uniref:3-hydroxyacyl-ACP dehydratase FabZ family protein n=1 Tax=Streptomyces sp. NRRL S-37 TaxID=1463903 RepID=UPI000689956B|nr:MaoC/PaaZ C-terminal domain-containing protein [Streptomyces sp. NRRL S-37]